MDELASYLVASLRAVGPEAVDILSGLPPFLQENLSLIRATFILVSIILIGGIVYALKQTFKDFMEFRGLTWRDFLGLGNRWPKRYLKSWRFIEKSLKIRDKKNMKMAVLGANQMFGDLLEVMNYPGENYDERLEVATSAQFSNLEDLRKAHKRIGKLADNPEDFIDYDEAKELVEIFKIPLEEFYVLRS